MGYVPRGGAFERPPYIVQVYMYTCTCIQEKSVFEIALELNRLHELGDSGELRPADTADGTFSLSNIGAIGGTYTDPMLLPPSVAIGAFGKVQVCLLLVHVCIHTCTCNNSNSETLRKTKQHNSTHPR